jgi:integrase/recombinase XerD
LSSYRRDLHAWAAWLAPRELLAADRGDVEGWLAHQFRAKAKATSVARRLSALRRFYRLQLERATVREDPTVRVRAPKQPRRLPKLLSEAQVEALLAAPATETTLGLRDRAMLETLYATGLRVSELVGCAWRRSPWTWASARHGKRVRRAVPWATKRGMAATLRRGVADAGGERKMNAAPDQSPPRPRAGVLALIKRYALKSAIAPAALSPHVLRHVCHAPLNHGADLRRATAARTCGHHDD